MRDAGYVTLIDPLQRRYGARVGALLSLPTLIGEVLWAATTLSALGTTLAVLVGLDRSVSIVVSTAVAVFYALLGGLYSVAYTDVIQLVLILIGVCSCIPFALSSGFVSSDGNGRSGWIGTLKTAEYSDALDNICLLILGSIPTQAYFQRILSARDGRQARLASCVGALVCLLFAIPPVWIGAIGKRADWPSVPTFARNVSADESTLILPLVMQHLTPRPVAYLGLGAVAAAVMSSADSVILSCSTMFAHNLYRGVVRPTASEREIVIVVRLVTLLVGCAATAIALSVDSIYRFLIVTGDLTYVLLLPQLIAVVYLKRTNTTGALVSFVFGVGMRAVSGLDQPLLGVDALSAWWRKRFPLRTLTMLASFALLVVVSRIADWWWCGKNALVEEEEHEERRLARGPIGGCAYLEEDTTEAFLPMFERTSLDDASRRFEKEPLHV